MEEGQRKFNAMWLKFFRASAIEFLAGPPYDKPNQVDGQFVWAVRNDGALDFRKEKEENEENE